MKNQSLEVSPEETHKAIDETLEKVAKQLPYEEHKTHDAICNFLESQGVTVTRHTYGLDTSFECISGKEGRMMNFNAEYDALPYMGHACGHNLIATSSTF
ncbi:hypothetical protein N7495_003732 [Penicillium taxi]|uniref:uncharacterized protein n=1 Tax=Penicillium taxi TaxID=168475 RepID=UPI0025458D00|nr:uncharacterized protein N7495_003732 [Penicillium taxi]KAJ5898988.1 hypothetical protein N7495_003732 [Penicillium taxi]